MFEKLKHWFDCHIRKIHFYDMGFDYEAWKEETRRQCETVGYADCYCRYCGTHLMRIVVGDDNGKSE